MAIFTSRQTASTLAIALLGLFLTPAAVAGPLSSAPAATSGGSAVVQVDHDWDDDDYYSRRYDRRHAYSGRPYYRYGYGYGYGYGYDYGHRRYGRRHVTVDAPFASVRVRPRGVWVRAPFVRLYVPRY